MKTIGMVMWASGLALAAYAGLIFDPSVSGYGGGRIVNMDLQQRQMMMLIVGCVLFAVGVVLHAISAKMPDQPDRKGVPKETGPSIGRIAYALDLGIMDTDAGFTFNGQAYSDIEDAIKAADPDKRKAMPDFGKVGW